jgi:hypothetical protein
VLERELALSRVQQPAAEATQAFVLSAAESALQALESEQKELLGVVFYQTLRINF